MNSLRGALLTFLLSFSLLATAQSPQTAAPAPTPNPSTPSAEKPLPAAPGDPSKPGTTGDTPKADVPSSNSKKPAVPHRLTPDEAKTLLQSVDEVLHFASQDTLLPIKHGVKKAIVSREQVEKYLDEKFKSDVDRQRFERSELVLKKFGLLPRTFELHDFLIKLLGEQVAGFYNEKSKTMNLLDWVEVDMQKPVMAHELTHALQDQSYDLEKLSKMEEEIEKRGLDDLDAVIRNDEESTCRTAVLEGQAMIVLLDYVLAPAGRSVQDSPKLVDMMQASMEKSEDSPIFDRAPLLLQEELMFPYRQGMGFIKELLLAGGKKLAYTGVLDRPPKTTREIMEPKEYLAGRRVPPLMLPDLGFLKKQYEAFDAGAVGEFDAYILLKVYADDAVAKKLSTDWRGGAYYAAGRRGSKPTDPNATSHVGLLYVSRWTNEDSAKEFARIYGSALQKRYTGLQKVEADPKQPGLQKYSSNDGLIFIQQTGDIVAAVESFDADTADKLIKAGVKRVQGQTEQVSR